MANKDAKQQAQPGSGSAENKGQERREQVNQSKDISREDRQHIADEIGEHPSKLANLRDLGSLSGRDDASGGSGDRMENESTGRRTDR